MIGVADLSVDQEIYPCHHLLIAAEIVADLFAARSDDSLLCAFACSMMWQR